METTQESAPREAQPDVRRGLTVSDLHLFSDYTQAERLLPLLNQAIHREGEAPAAMVVLNGDIFDFEYPGRFSFEHELEKMGVNPHVEADRNLLRALGIKKLPTTEQEQDPATREPMSKVDQVLNLSIVWLYKFCTDHPQTKVHYVIGNHDGAYCHDTNQRDLRKRLKKLKGVLKEEGVNNFRFHGEYFVPASNALFTHGDLPLRHQDIHSRPYIPIDEIHAPKYTLKEVLSRLALGDRSVNLGRFMEQIVYENKPLLDTTRLIAEYHNRAGRIDPLMTRNLSKVSNGYRDTFHIFTGHTHIPRTNDEKVTHMLDNKSYEMYDQHFLFHNTGSAVCPQEFNMLEFELKEESLVKNGKEKKRTVLHNVHRAPELVTLPLSWAQKMMLQAIHTGYSLPLARV